MKRENDAGQRLRRNLWRWFLNGLADALPNPILVGKLSKDQQRATWKECARTLRRAQRALLTAARADGFRFRRRKERP